MQNKFVEYVATISSKFIKRIKVGSYIPNLLDTIYDIFVGSRIAECTDYVVDFPAAKYCKPSVNLLPTFDFEIGDPLTPVTGIFIGYWDLAANGNTPADVVGVAAEINASSPNYSSYSTANAGAGQLVNVPATQGTIVVAYDALLGTKTILNTANVDITDDFVLVQEIINGVLHNIHIALFDIAIPVTIKVQ